MLHRIKREAEAFFENGGIYKEDGIKIARDMENAYIKEKISPGGSADLLAITIFLYFFKKLFFI